MGWASLLLLDDWTETRTASLESSAALEITDKCVFISAWSIKISSSSLDLTFLEAARNV